MPSTNRMFLLLLHPPPITASGLDCPIPDAQAKAFAEREGVDIRLYRVIYQAIEDIEAAMKGMLDPVYEEKVIGHAEVRQIFRASAIGNIAGSYVLDGYFQRDCKVRITRRNESTGQEEQIYEGALASLKRIFKDDVKGSGKGWLRMWSCI